MPGAGGVSMFAQPKGPPLESRDYVPRLLPKAGSKSESEVVNKSKYATELFLLDHCRQTLGFYHPRALDSSAVGGFYHSFKDSGELGPDVGTRHLVSSTRFVFNYAQALMYLCDDGAKTPEYLSSMAHGVKFLREKHRNAESGGYAWTLEVSGDNVNVKEGANHCYGAVFVLLAYSVALKAVKQLIEKSGETKELRAYEAEYAGYVKEHHEKILNLRFWDAKQGLLVDELNEDFSKVTEYRGQDPNMHGVEAYIMAYEATLELQYLARALVIATNVVERLSVRPDALRTSAIGDVRLPWEHFTPSWGVDWSHKGETPNKPPYGFLVGHFAEWTKLLVHLRKHVDALDDLKQDDLSTLVMSGDSNLAGVGSTTWAWLVPRAVELFNVAVDIGWDQSNGGGLQYTFAPDVSKIVDADKYFWTQAETLAAAAVLARYLEDDAPKTVPETTDTGEEVEPKVEEELRFEQKIPPTMTPPKEPIYLKFAQESDVVLAQVVKCWGVYDKLWSFVDANLVDKQHGGWYRVLDGKTKAKKDGDYKSPPGKCDYHNMGACYDIVRALRNGRGWQA